MIKKAAFIDGRNFKYATYDSLGIKVDFKKLLDILSAGAYLIRAYYYSGIWTEESIRAFIRLRQKDEGRINLNLIDSHQEEIRNDLFNEYMEKRRKDLDFLRFLNRTGYYVVTKPVRVYRDYLTGEIAIKADLDIEIVLDMIKLADYCDEIVLVSGDGDFIPVVKELQGRGVRVIVMTTLSKEAQNRGYKASEELIDTADEFIELEELRNKISR
jgi:uncharacterized LabA/DUF88 family protein